MALVEEMQANGNWLFRWRSYLPLSFLAVTAALLPFKGDAAGALPGLGEIWEWVCLGVAALGLVIRALAIGAAPKGTSGRNTGSQVAHEVNRTGLYSVVRHPLYLGNFFAYLGVVLYAAHPWFAGLFLLAFWLYYERIMLAEEAYLRESHGAAYADWADSTPAFIPRLSLWRKAGLPFSPLTVVAEEYASQFAVILAFALLRGMEALVLATDPFLDRLWAALFAAALAYYLTVRITKKLGGFNTLSRR